jgi:flagellar biosynthesis/type III secretory pathway chaperone
MNVKIIELMDILDEEAACYRDMQRVLTEEQASISFSRKECFDQVQCKKETLVVKLQQLEEKRKALVGQLSERYATDGNSMTVSQLARVVKSPARAELLARANGLRAIIGDVHEKNRHNQQMINQSLDLINGSLTLLTRLIEDSSVYQKPGTHQSAAGYPIGGGRLIRGTA